jgi:hypothetical protein
VVVLFMKNYCVAQAHDSPGPVYNNMSLPLGVNFDPLGGMFTPPLFIHRGVETLLFRGTKGKQSVFTLFRYILRKRAM